MWLYKNMLETTQANLGQLVVVSKKLISKGFRQDNILQWQILWRMNNSEKQKIIGLLRLLSL